MKKIHCFIFALFLSLIAAAQMNFQGSYDWDNNANELFPSIQHAFLDLTSPRLMKVHAVRIDLKDGKLGFFATPPDVDAGKVMPDYPDLVIRTKRQTTRDFMRMARRSKSEGGFGLDMLVAANANGWNPWCHPWDQPYATNNGLIVSEGKIVAPSKGNHSFLVMKDGSVDIKYVAKDAEVPNVNCAVTGFSPVLLDNVVQFRNADLNPRTAIGVSKDKRYVVIMTIDGRQKGFSEGAKTDELGEFLAYFGCSDGLNLDGGGSTTLAYWDVLMGDGVVLSHQPGGKYERTVGCNIGIYLKPEKAE